MALLRQVASFIFPLYLVVNRGRIQPVMNLVQSAWVGTLLDAVFCGLFTQKVTSIVVRVESGTVTGLV
jgi:hypothetical protein